MMKYLLLFLSINILLPAQQWFSLNTPPAHNKPSYETKFFNDSIGYYSYPFNLKKTTDGGYTFETVWSTTITNDNAIQELVFIGKDTFFVYHHHKVGFTTDGGYTINYIPNANSTASFSSAKIGWAVENDYKIKTTTDGGVTWYIRMVYPDSWRFKMNSIKVIDDSLGFVIPKGYYNEYIFKSTDGGVNWAWQFIGNLNRGAITTYGSTLYLYSDNRLLKSIDRGNNWDPLPLPESGLDGASQFFVKNKTILIMARGKFYTTTNEGLTWKVNTFPAAVPYGSFDLVNDSTIAYASNGESFFKSYDLGETWINTNHLTGDFTTHYFLNDSVGWIAGDHLLKTTDKGSSWKLMQHSRIDFYRIHFHSENEAIALIGSGWFFETTDGGKFWRMKEGRVTFSPPYTGFYFWGDTGILFSGLKSGKTTDKGRTWDYSNPMDIKGEQITALSANKAIIVGVNGSFKTVDGGNNWTALGGVKGEGVAFYDSLNGIISMNGDIHRTTDGGESFFIISRNETLCNSKTNIQMFDSLTAIAIDCKYSVIKTSDGGVTWHLFFNNPNPSPYSRGNAHFLSAKTGIYYGRDGYLFRYGDETIPVELSFFDISVNESKVSINWSTSSEVNNARFEIERDKRIIAIIKGNGSSTEINRYSYLDEPEVNGEFIYTLFQVDYDGTRRKLSEKKIDISALPLYLTLHQNYPNPFNPATYISFYLPEQSFVELTVYDILGNKVTTLINEIKNAGNHIETFDASALAGGIYICRLQTGAGTVTNKMILLK